MNIDKQIYITVNSPGEIAGWLKPAVKDIKKDLPDYKFKVLLLPCVFASGSEKRVIESIPEIDEVIPASSFLSLLMDSDEHANTFFLHFGGDLALTAILAKRWKTHCFGYQWGTKASDPYYKGYFVKTEADRELLIKRGISESKIHVTGDLLYDSVMNNLESQGFDFKCYSNDYKIETIAFMGGSRDIELKTLLPFFLKTAKLLKEKQPELKFKAIISPFINWDKFVKENMLFPQKGFDGLSGHVDKCRLVSEEYPDLYIDLIKENQYKALAESDFVISIPGTKTGEAACLEKPMLVIMPLNRPDQIPYVGLVGLLDWIPFFGRSIKGKLVLQIGKNFGFVSQPNILAKEEVVPEMMDVLTPEKISDKVFSIIAEPKLVEDMKKKLHDLYAPFKYASKKLSEIFVSSVKGLKRTDKPYFSVIICSRNRKDLLKGTIETLDIQTIPSDSYEVIVVDDGSEDGTGDMINSLKTKCRLKYIYKDWGGRSATRNVGISEAGGEIAVFVDDDIIAPENFLEEVARYHRIYPNSIVRGPIINITEYKNPGTRAKFKDYSAATFCTCNASAPLEAIRKAGGFDETFLEYGYEDNEMGWRLLKAGLSRHFNMKAIVYHYKPHKIGEDLHAIIANAQELARSAVLYYRKHDDIKVRLATKITPFNFLRHKLFHYAWLNNICKKIWKYSAMKKYYFIMSFFEPKIRDYYYMKTIVEEMSK